jgi:hypothetical protein
MSKLLSWLAATTTGSAIVTVTPALAFQGGGFGGGMGGMRMSRQVFVGGAPRFVGAPFAGRLFVRTVLLRLRTVLRELLLAVSLYTIQLAVG